MLFIDRRDAGRQLSTLLAKYKGQDVVVYGLPRGGVVVAKEIATALNAPLEVLLARKIGHPHQPEYAIAAISESGHLLGNTAEIRALGQGWLEKEKEKQIQEIKRRRIAYFKGRKETSVNDKIAILVDDGIATGLTLKVTIEELKDKKPKKIIIAVPVSPKGHADQISKEVNEFIAVAIPDDVDFLGAVGAYYRFFNQIEDDEVIEILENHFKTENK